MNVQERVNHILCFQWQQTNSFLLSRLENYKFQIDIGTFECLCLHKYLNICMHNICADYTCMYIETNCLTEYH